MCTVMLLFSSQMLGAFPSTGRKTVRKISVPTLILYEIHQAAFTHALMVTSRSPSG